MKKRGSPKNEHWDSLVLRPQVDKQKPAKETEKELSVRSQGNHVCV
jgi:hypothetical protein